MMKKFTLYIPLLLVVLIQKSPAMDYDLQMTVETPRINHGQMTSRGMVLIPGITLYPDGWNGYLSSEAAMGKGGLEITSYGGKYYQFSTFFLQPEIGLSWWERTDSLASLLSIAVNPLWNFPVKFLAEWDPLAGRLLGRGEVYTYQDWKMPWILSFSAGVNLSDYPQGKLYRPAGLSDLKLGISTWAEIGPYYGEISLRGGPVFHKFHYDSFIISCRFLFIWSQR